MIIFFYRQGDLSFLLVIDSFLVYSQNGEKRYIFVCLFCFDFYFYALFFLIMNNVIVIGVYIVIYDYVFFYVLKFVNLKKMDSRFL